MVNTWFPVSQGGGLGIHTEFDYYGERLRAGHGWKAAEGRWWGSEW